MLGACRRRDRAARGVRHAVTVPIAAVTIDEHTLLLHGHRVRCLIAGEGPALALLHGITSSADSWRAVMPALARHHTVITPDLLGHGNSAKPRGDYSLGAYASGVRDLLAALGYDRVTVVGHSLGGGIAMQFAYQFPERAERLVLVSSGGLGRDVHLALRAATLPGSELVLPLIAGTRVRDAGAVVGKVLGKLGLRLRTDLAEIARGYGSLADAEARHAFVLTMRAVLDASGQRVTAADRLYLTAGIPTLLIWGERDPIIPADHGRDAHAAMPGSRLALLPEAGHFPHLDDPVGFAEVLEDFISDTEPARADPERLRRLLLAGAQ
jgi:pimeloyl-ACP methyl ester carboxylesterase